jgi:Tfp pilus assembly protein PilE
MKKNNIYKLILSALLAFTMGSCDKSLDIDPKQTVDATTALETDGDFTSAVVGAYSILGGGALYGTNLNIMPELQAYEGYTIWSGTFQTYRQIANKTTIISNADVTRTWVEGYQAINIANLLLQNISKIQDEDLRTEIEGEAEFVRGIVHFELVRFYGLPYEAGIQNIQAGVPIMLTGVADSEGAYMLTVRKSVEEVYAQVIKDLTAASEKLTESGTSNRASKYTAMAFLTRVYLQMGQYDKARDLANTIIAESGKTLNTSVTAAFSNKNTNETLFEIQANDQNNVGTSNDGLTTFYSGQTDGTGRADFYINAEFLKEYEAADTRKINLIYVGRRSRNYSGKWLTFGQNIPVIRLAEMYLVRAECNARLRTVVGDTPLNDLNLIRRRAGATLKTAATLDLILNERILELSFEGLRIHDFKRTKRSTGTYTYNSDELVFPIPEREMRANKSLVQNPGYE